MAPVDEPEETVDDQETGAALDVGLPFDEGDQQREGKEHHAHGQEMAHHERPQCPHEGAGTSGHEPG